MSIIYINTTSSVVTVEMNHMYSTVIIGKYYCVLNFTLCLIIASRVGRCKWSGHARPC